MIDIDLQITPSLSLAIADRHLGWALTLSALTLFFLKAAPRLIRYSLGLAVFLLSIAPTSWSISHWLGLAYQTPSLVTQALSLLYLLRCSKVRDVHGITSRFGRVWRDAVWPRTARRVAGYISAVRGRNAPARREPNREAISCTFLSSAGQPCATIDNRWPVAVLLLACLTGWALALDTFAKLPIQLYALGYSRDLSIGLLLVAMLIWIFGRFNPSTQSGHRLTDLAVILLIAILIHTLTRLPSGNLWDAVLDPWLWLVAQGALIGRVATGATRKRLATQGST